MKGFTIEDLENKGFEFDGKDFVKPKIQLGSDIKIISYVPVSIEKKSKYNNKIVWYNDVKYQSQKEADYAKNLDWKLKASEIKSWSRQVQFVLIVNGYLICKYYVDFKVVHNDDKIEYVDVKGYKKGVAYRLFETKSRLVKALYNIDIIEV